MKRTNSVLQEQGVIDMITGGEISPGLQRMRTQRIVTDMSDDEDDEEFDDVDDIA